MITLPDEFKKMLYASQLITPFIKIIFEKTGVDSVRGLKSWWLNVADFASRFGSISRSMSYDIGKFRPGGHSFTLENTKDAGDYLFTLRKNFGLNYWNDKTYHILWGFREIPTSATVEESLPLISSLGMGRIPSEIFDSPITLGFGVHPGGFTSIAEVREEVVALYSGDIFSKKEDRINDRIEVSSKDIIKRLHDFKVCTIINHSTIFNYQTSSDYNNVGIQQVIKYGTHKLIRTGDSKEVTNRESPFTCTMGFPNFASADMISSSSYVAAYFLWYFPFMNDISRGTLLGVDSPYKLGTVKAYYWDYRNGKRKWREFHKDDIELDTSRDIQIWSDVNADGLYLKVLNNTLTNTGIEWDHYVAGTDEGGAGIDWSDGGDTEADPAVCIESIDNLVDSNPVRVIYDLLTSTRFIDFNPSIIDQSSFSSPIPGYSFDDTFTFFNGESALVNTSYDREISILKIIENIAKLCAMYFFSSVSKNIHENGEIAEDRRIKLLYNRTVSPCADAPSFLARFSTAGKLQDFDTTINSTDLKDKIIVTNFDSSVSSKENFDVQVQGTGDRALQLSAPINPKAYFYNAGNAADAIAQRLLSQLENPVEQYNLRLDASGLPVELGDYIELHDYKNAETIIAQIFNWLFRLATGATNLVARRYTDLYGPDPNNIYKVWAFIDCAYYDNNQAGGNGANASCPASTTVTLGGGETIDLNLAFIGMDVTLDGNSQANSEHRRLKSITSTTVFEVDAAFTNNHANVTWSIGTSYHVY